MSWPKLKSKGVGGGGDFDDDAADMAGEAANDEAGGDESMEGGGGCGVIYELRACNEDIFICIPGFGMLNVNWDVGDWADEEGCGEDDEVALRAMFSDWRRESRSRRLSFSFCFSWLTASRAATLSSRSLTCFSLRSLKAL